MLSDGMQQKINIIPKGNKNKIKIKLYGGFKMNMNEFVKRNNIKINVEWAERNPNMINDAWSKTANHYKTTLKKDKKQLTVYFSMGSALTNEPTAEEVIDSLAMDGSVYLNNDSFENFCGEFGYDEDSRKAEKLYNTILKQAEKTEKFLGNELFNQLVYDVERL